MLLTELFFSVKKNLSIFTPWCGLLLWWTSPSHRELTLTPLRSRLHEEAPAESSQEVLPEEPRQWTCKPAVPLSVLCQSLLWPCTWTGAMQGARLLLDVQRHWIPGNDGEEKEKKNKSKRKTKDTAYKLPFILSKVQSSSHILDDLVHSGRQEMCKYGKVHTLLPLNTLTKPVRFAHK